MVGDGDAEMQAPTARQIHEDGGDDVATDRPKTLWRPDKTLFRPEAGRRSRGDPRATTPDDHSPKNQADARSDKPGTCRG